MFIVIFIIIFGAIVGVLSWLIIRLLTAPRQTKAIGDLIKQGKHGLAIRAAKGLAAKDPRNAEARWLLGQAYLGEGKHELALMEFKHVNQLGSFGPELPEIAFRKEIASLYERFNQMEDALKEQILLTKLEPRVALHFLDAGRLFEARGRSDVAVNHLRKAIELDERLFEAHHLLAMVLHRTKHDLEARQEFEAAIKWNPEDFEAFYYIGKIHKEAGDHTAALLAFEKAARSGPFKIKALVERGSCYMSQGNLEKAVPELERAIKMVKDETATEALFGRYFLALCYEKQRELDKAIEQWEKIYQKKPGFRDVAEKLTQYQEYRSDDHMKDFLTCGREEFMEMCRAVVQGPMNLSIRDASEIQGGVQVIAVENDSDKWMGTKKQPRLIRFLRVSENQGEQTIRALLEQMKKLGVMRGSIVTSASFARAAVEFAENRSVELFPKELLQGLLARLSTDVPPSK
ncbi:MAG: tetratricopeptide repeat protein [Rectinemataceae bacterium]